MTQGCRLPALLLVGLIIAAAPALARQRPPTRDTTAPRRPAGTASLAGHVLSADTGRPIARARVSASLQPPADGAGPGSTPGQGEVSYATLTDHAGAFVITDLPAGRYTVNAAKMPYLSVNYGAARPQRRGKRVTLKQGQQVRNVDVRLPRGGVLTGRVYDDSGEPIVRASVQALRQMYLQGEPRLVNNGMAQTDDRGQFRIYGLAPGSYAVTASAYMEVVDAANASSTDPSVAQTYAPTYYPGVTNAAEAVTIPLGVQQEYSNVDFMLQAVPTARVTGTVVGEAGAVGTVSVVLFADDPRGVSASTNFGGRVQEDGGFTVTGVPPGRYLAVARSSMGPGPRFGGRGGDGRPPLVGIQPVSVAGQDVTGVTIALSNGGTIAGWVTVESASGQRIDFNRLRLSTTPAVPMPFGGGEAGRIQPDGSFTIGNLVAGSHLLRVNYPPTGWALKGIFLGGKDVSDQALDVKNGQTTGGLQVVLTDRLTSVTGTVVGASLESVSDCYVVLFPTDSAAWRPHSRAIFGRRPDETGSSRFTGVPPGDYYLAVAPDLEPGSWYEPQLLGELTKTATRLSVQEGDAKTVTLKIGAPSTED